MTTSGVTFITKLAALLLVSTIIGYTITTMFLRVTESFALLGG